MTNSNSEYVDKLGLFKFDVNDELKKLLLTIHNNVDDKYKIPYIRNIFSRDNFCSVSQYVYN